MLIKVLIFIFIGWLFTPIGSKATEVPVCSPNNPNQIPYDPIGRVGIYDLDKNWKFRTSGVFDYVNGPRPGALGSIIMSYDEALALPGSTIDSIKKQGYSIIVYIHLIDSEIENSVNKSELQILIDKKVDMFIYDEPIERHHAYYVKKLKYTWSQLVTITIQHNNSLFEAIKSINPKIQYGVTEGSIGLMDIFLKNGGKADFVGGENYMLKQIDGTFAEGKSQNIRLENLDLWKKLYGKKTMQWVTSSELGKRYIGKVDLVIFADVNGIWGSYPSGSHYDYSRELKNFFSTTSLQLCKNTIETVCKDPASPKCVVDLKNNPIPFNPVK